MLSAGPDGYSRSYVGHAAFIALLRELDIPVVVSRSPPETRPLGSAVLVIAEPRPWEGDAAARRLRDLLRAGARAVLLVLPKWEEAPDPARPTWVRGVAPFHPEDVAMVLAEAGIDGREVVRLAEGAAPAGERALPAEAPEPPDPPKKPPTFDLGPYRSAPVLAHPRLLRVGAGSARPIIAASEGALLVEVVGPRRTGGGDPRRRETGARGIGAPPHRSPLPAGEREKGTGTILVLADPDLISTHGLRKGENAALAVEIIERLRGPDGVVVIDETVHGHEVEASIWRELFDFPLVLAVVQAAFAAGALLFAGLRRFGSPLPPPPAMAAGKEGLIQNTADLQRFAGHSAHALKRYLASALREVGEALHAPAGLGEVERREWLDRVAEARGLEVRLPDLVSGAGGAKAAGPSAGAGAPLSGHAIVGVARRIHRWRREMLHGRAGHP